MSEGLPVTVYTILVTGDRNWTSPDDLIRRTLRDVWMVAARKGLTIMLIHGDAPGADSIAAAIGRELGFTVVPFPAKWPILGHGAGPRRNQEMLDQGKPNLVLAFHDNLWGTKPIADEEMGRMIQPSKGTKDMVERARKAGIPVAHWTNKTGCTWYNYTFMPAKGKAGNTLPGVDIR